MDKIFHKIMLSIAVSVVFCLFAFPSAKSETVVTSMGDETVPLGGRALLSCSISDRGSKTVTWKRLTENHPLTIGESVFTYDDRITIYINQIGTWTLSIQDVKLSDEGTYVCLVTTKENLSNASAHVQLTVKTIQLTGPTYIERASPLKLVCNISARPFLPHDVTWLHDNHVVLSDDSVGISIMNQLVEDKYVLSEYTKTRVELRDAGTYHCRGNSKNVYDARSGGNFSAQNSYKSQNASIVVNVIDDFLILSGPTIDLSKAPRTLYTLEVSSQPSIHPNFSVICVALYFIIWFQLNRLGF